jgi:ferredoxin--NADP+ reductase
MEIELNATLQERRDVSDGYAILRIRPDALPIPSFVPGQFVQLGLPEPAPPRPGAGADAGPPRMRIAKRSYSIASSPRETDHYELFVVLVSEGRLTPHLWTIPAGGRCWIGDRAHGLFTLEKVPPDRDLVMVATGTGICPYVSMLRTHREDPPWRRCVLVHGVRRAADLAYDAELRARAGEDGRFRYVPVVSRDPGSVVGLHGRVQVALDSERFPSLAGFPLDPAACEVFLCGNPGMIGSVRELLAPLGFARGTAASSGNLHFEKYW